MSNSKTVVQNEETPIEIEDREFAAECAQVCAEATFKIFEHVLKWNPVKVAAELAGQMLLAKAENTMPLFGEECALTLKQQEYLKSHVTAVFAEAASVALTKVKDYETEADDFVGRMVIREMITIPEKTMAAVGHVVNRGASLAMSAVQANAKSEDKDEIIMWKGKQTGDITIPTRGIFISTNCVEKIKAGINFREVKNVVNEVM